jgi:hypothetical protein
MAKSKLDTWPSLALDEWKDTYATLHMWTQIVGKIRLEQSPLVNHWWNVTLYVTSHGLTTTPLPYGGRCFEIEFDFINHQLIISTSEGDVRALPLIPQSVAAFYREVMAALNALGFDVKINTMPQEVPEPIPFPDDNVHTSYDADAANRFWRILMQTDNILKEFRSRFIGKVSPVQFFWGSFDLAVTRFSGRRAPERVGADLITREAYSHEVISHGFWPGGGEIKGPAFYAYAAPEPSEYGLQTIHPPQAFYKKEMSQFLLMYDDVRNMERPDKAVLEFCQSTYDAGANLAGWDRAGLERGSN